MPFWIQEMQTRASEWLELKLFHLGHLLTFFAWLSDRILFSFSSALTFTNRLLISLKV